MAGKNRQIVYLFSEVDSFNLDLLGGKGLGLVKMTQYGYPVPPGLVIITGVCRAVQQEGSLPKRFSWQLQRGIRLLERQTKKQFGGAHQPLLFAVRSGAKVSMPGMMDTVLNLGLNETTLTGLIEETRDERFALDTYRRFLAQFGATVLGVQKESFDDVLQKAMQMANVEHDSTLSVPCLREICAEYRQIIEQETGRPMVDDPWEQLNAAVAAVHRSWMSERAVEYRKTHGIPEKLGTAVVVQSMVFGNSGDHSGTGVVFSRNVATGEPGLYGEYLSNAQGEDVVAGVRTPTPIQNLAVENPGLYTRLQDLVSKLEIYYKDVVDVEFTVEHGQLYLLQVRVAKRTPLAAVKIAVSMVSEGCWTEQQAVAKVSADDLKKLEQLQFDPEAFQQAVDEWLLVRGLPASEGAAVGMIVFDPTRAKQFANSGKSVILIRQETSPEDFGGMLASAAFVTARGGKTSHAAVVARALGKPAVVGCKGLEVRQSCAIVGNRIIYEGHIVSVNGSTGEVVLGEVALTQQLSDPDIETFKGWVAQYRKNNQLDFSLVEKSYNMNTCLNDFYLIDALTHASVGTPLHRAALALKANVHSEVASAMAVYLLLAVAGELSNAWRTSSGNDDLLQEITHFGVTARGDSSHERELVQKKVVSTLQNMRPESAVEFARLGTKVFRERRWNASYGGAKWALIAEALYMYLQGELDQMLFVDRAFDLRHNGGVLFNKHRMVATTNEYLLQSQLNAKRDAVMLEMLERDLRSIHPSVSLCVQELMSKWAHYQKGESQ